MGSAWELCSSGLATVLTSSVLRVVIVALFWVSDGIRPLEGYSSRIGKRICVWRFGWDTSDGCRSFSDPGHALQVFHGLDMLLVASSSMICP